MDLDYLYVPRSELIAMGQDAFEGEPLSGHIQINLPAEKGLLFITKGWVFIDLDTDERIISVRLQRGRVPR